MLGMTTVAIVGPSMEPTLTAGQWWLVRRTRQVRPGQIVVFWHPILDDFLTVKRVHHRRRGGWWLLGDNPDASEDSRSLGLIDPALIVGRLVLQYRPLFALARS